MDRDDDDMAGISTLKYFSAATSSNATPSDANYDGGDATWYYFDKSSSINIVSIIYYLFILLLAACYNVQL